MGNNMDNNETNIKKHHLPTILSDVICGFVMGVAFIIPGFSGGSVAAILGIYEKLIGAVADIFKSFKKSFFTLLPIGIGLILGAASLLFPLKWALNFAPIPTVALFVGLALGGMFSITDKLRGKIKPTNIIAFLIPLAVAAALCFAPTGADVELLNMSAFGYITLFGVGILGSAALVVPGISGSMILLILGYYNPIISVITDHFLKGKDMLRSVLVLGVTALGIAVGFFLISTIMKRLLEKCPRGTYFAIVGFIIGSVPSAFMAAAKDAGYTLTGLPTSPLYWAASVLLLVLGFVGALLFVIKASRLSEKDTREEK